MSLICRLHGNGGGGREREGGGVRVSRGGRWRREGEGIEGVCVWEGETERDCG